MRHRLPTLAEKVAFLSRPGAYGPQARSVRHIETHFAFVFLTAEQAYKLKKPIRHKQLDYRTLAARERGCREELSINRRFAGAVYQQVVPLTWNGRALTIGGNGEVVDWLVRMRRLPDALMLDRALAAGRAGERDVARVVRKLLRTYKTCTPHPISSTRYLEHLAREVRDNRRQISSYTDHIAQQLASEVCAAQLGALRHLRRPLSARGVQVVDGHGDLRAEHVYLGSPMVVIDALEFDPKLRRLDPAEEFSLLALEVERLGHPQLAEQLLTGFRRGMRAAPEPEVFAFYRSHRAATRAKLAAWHLGDPQFPDSAPWVARTESLLEDALRYAKVACGAPLPERARSELESLCGKANEVHSAAAL